MQELYSRVVAVRDGLASGSLIRDAITGHGEDIIERQRIQLLRGLASDGQDLRPYYSEDLKPRGWFYSVETAGRYAAMKQDIAYPYQVERNPDAPNLYFNGRFHDELGVAFEGQGVAIVGETGYARRIVAKYGAENFGLMPEYWAEIWRETGALDELLEALKTELYG